MAHTVWFRDIYILQKSGYIMGGSFVILLSAAYLRQLYTSEETDNIFRDPMFWFSQAWFLNFAVMVPVAALENYLRKNFPDFGLNYSLMVTDISDCLRSLLLMTGFLCIGVPRK
jgi:hypothetical protein